MGRFADRGRSFWASLSNTPEDCGWSGGGLRLAGQSQSLQVYLANGSIALIRSPRPLLTGPGRQQQGQDAPPGGQAPSLPKFLALPTDETSGLVVLPSTKVTTIVERSALWHKVLGPIDGAAAAILAGHLSYPRDCWDWEPVSSANHPSWENDLAAKKALGPTIAAWIHSGILEWVPPSCPPPLVVEPLGAVEKSTAPFYRLISDARRSNKCLSKWAVRCMNLSDMASALDYGAIMSGDDVNDAYHVSPFGGCTGGLVEDFGLTCGPDGHWQETARLHVGCSNLSRHLRQGAIRLPH